MPQSVNRENCKIAVDESSFRLNNFSKFSLREKVVEKSISGLEPKHMQLTTQKQPVENCACVLKRVSSEVDGYQAWKTLACVFILNATTLGALKVHGIIFEMIVKNGHMSRELASWPIASATTIQNLAGPLTPLLTMRVSWRNVEIFQTVILLIGNFGAFFNNQTYFFIDLLCLGVLQGLALSIRYNMNVVINNEYFEKYRTTAMGFALAGSTTGLFMLKPLIVYSLDNYGVRSAYLTLGIVVFLNLVLNLNIREPKQSNNREDTFSSKNLNDDYSSRKESVLEERKKITHQPMTPSNNHSLFRRIGKLFSDFPAIHFLWLMQTIYFYTNRSYTIFIVDHGVDNGLEIESSRMLIDFWVYGELLGRVLLGRLIDTKILSIKWNVIVINCILSALGFCLLFDINDISFLMPSPNATYFWLLGIFLTSLAALTSLLNMVIVPFAQETIGKANVPWAYAVCSVMTGLVLLFRPLLFGLSRDIYGSYDLFIIIMSSFTLCFSIMFLVYTLFSKKT